VKAPTSQLEENIQQHGKVPSPCPCSVTCDLPYSSAFQELQQWAVKSGKRTTSQHTLLPATEIEHKRLTTTNNIFNNDNNEKEMTSQIIWPERKFCLQRRGSWRSAILERTTDQNITEQKEQ